MQRIGRALRGFGRRGSHRRDLRQEGLEFHFSLIGIGNELAQDLDLGVQLGDLVVRNLLDLQQQFVQILPDLMAEVGILERARGLLRKVLTHADAAEPSEEDDQDDSGHDEVA